MSEPISLTLTGLVRSGAVVQAGAPVLLRGRATPGVMVTVTLGDQRVAAQAHPETGHWRCELLPLPVGGPYEGSVVDESGGPEGRVTLTDLYSGQVWLCAGQSNMAMGLSFLAADEKPTPGDREQNPPVIRFAYMPVRVAASPLDTAAFQWDDALERTNRVSAVGYHFARTLSDKLQMPIGFVQAAVGHTPAMAWTARQHIPWGGQAYQKLKAFDNDLLAHPDARDNLDAWYQKLAPQMKQWNANVSQWLVVAREAHNAGKPIPPMPAYSTDLGNAHTPTALYNGMLAPLAGETVAGLLWYQGESDAILEYDAVYLQSLRGVIAGVRDLVGPVPAVIVELPRHYDIQCPRPDDAWPAVRWAQQQAAMSDATCGLVSTMDLGDTQMIHPTRKRTLAQRAGEIALALVYPEHATGLAHGRHGPVLKHARQQQDGIDLTFHGAAGPLAMAPSAGPQQAVFEVTLRGQWQRVDAQLTGDQQVRLTLPAGERATMVRYAWRGDPLPLLVDGAGWPVSGFSVMLPWG